MLDNRTTQALRDRWQAEIETYLEADQTPVLHLDGEQSFLHGAAALLALQRLAAARVDITAPVVLAGGVTPLWLAALMHGRGGEPPGGSPDIEVIYAGSDGATGMAARTLHAAGHRPLSGRAFLRPPAGLPPAFVGSLAPASEPGVSPSLTTLPIYAPLRAIEEQLDDAPTHTAPGRQPIDWTAQSAVLLAVVMVLAAVVLSLQP